MDYINDEVGKYKKKSNKTVKKSKHKHTYIECLLHDLKRNVYYVGEYCTDCGKIWSFKFGSADSETPGYSKMLSQEELLEKYKHYEIKEVDDLFKCKSVRLSLDLRKD